jgi:oxygen-dependent protoporphyrinogen oxidase
MRSARVVGAGLSGLTTAWWLAEDGWDVEVVDGSPQPGGLIHTRQTAFGPVERAANGFVYTPIVSDWFERVRVEPRFPGPLARRRFLYRAGRPRRWPLGPRETAELTGRLVAAWSARRLRPAPEERTVSDWSDRVLGRAATRWLVGPALQGIYGASAAELAVKAVFGSHRPRGSSRRLAAPAAGMRQFVEQLRAALEARGVAIRLGRAIDRLDAAVPTVVCTAAPAAARLLEPHAPDLASAIGRVRMISALTITAFFERSPEDLHGFGVLFPRETGFAARGVLFDSDIFPGRHRVRAERWIYTEDAPPATWASPLDLLRADRARLAGRDVVPLDWHAEVIPGALPCYDSSIVEVMARLEERPSWIALAGNYLGRLGVSALLEGASAAASSLDARGPAAPAGPRPLSASPRGPSQGCSRHQCHPQ